MGVDYYNCDGCDFGLRDDSDYCAWCDCGSKFCGIKCAQFINYGEWNEDDQSHAINNLIPITCIICRKEQFTDYGLLSALMKHYNLTLDQVKEIALNQND